MSSKLLLEFFKFIIFCIVVFLFIHYSENRIEIIGNQFVLNDEADFYHGKNISRKEDVCPLYPKTLSKRCKLFSYLHFEKDFKVLTCSGKFRCEYI